MSRLIKDVIDEYAGDIRFNAQKILQIVDYVQNFTRRNDNHIHFFSGNLVGVYPIRFMPDDRNTWIEEICEIIDFDGLKKDLQDLPEVVAKRHVSGNPLNHTFPWLLHHIYNSALINDKVRHLGMMTVMNMFQIKYLTGLDKHFFPHSASILIAQATYESLSRKSLIKQKGSWQGVIEYRSMNLINKKTTPDRHWEVITKMENNTNVVKVVNDIQNRVRNGYVNLSGKFHDTRDSEARILSKGTFVTIDGEQILRDVEHEVERYKRDIADIILSERDFIKPELLTDVLSIVRHTSESHMLNVLNVVLDNVEGRKKQLNLHDEIIDNVVFIFEYIKASKISKSNVPLLAERLASIYRAHKTKDKSVNELRNKMDYIVRQTIPIKHDATLAATKIGCMLYISLRILSIPYYN